MDLSSFIRWNMSQQTTEATPPLRNRHGRNMAHQTAERQQLDQKVGPAQLHQYVQVAQSFQMRNRKSQEVLERLMWSVDNQSIK